MPHNAKRIRVVIIDPPAGTREHTSLERARRYVARGQAEFVTPRSIRFCRVPTPITQPDLVPVHRGPWQQCWLNSEASVLRFPQEAA